MPARRAAQGEGRQLAAQLPGLTAPATVEAYAPDVVLMDIPGST
ncbi:hypothetical protein ACNAW0_25055 [Micromonospora sp. SL1-18]